MAKDKDRRVNGAEEDDGRTVADMSNVTRRSVFGFEPLRRRFRDLPDAASEEQDSFLNGEDRPWEKKELNGKDTGRYILGALGAGLLVGLIFIGAAALFIGLLLLIWK